MSHTVISVVYGFLFTESIVSTLAFQKIKVLIDFTREDSDGRIKTDIKEFCHSSKTPDRLLDCLIDWIPKCRCQVRNFLFTLFHDLFAIQV